MNPYADIAELAGQKNVMTVFDVGANVGQSALRLWKYFPAASIHSFEPVSACYRVGRQATQKIGKIMWHHAAVGSSTGSVRFYSSGVSQLSSISTSDPDPEKRADELNDVPIIRLDDFCEERGIASLDILKTDTEGFDLEVLKGAEQMFAKAAITCVLCETGFNSSDKSHSPFPAVEAYLAEHGFRLFQLYGISDKAHFQKWEYTYGDALFVKPARKSPLE